MIFAPCPHASRINDGPLKLIKCVWWSGRPPLPYRSLSTEKKKKSFYMYIYISLQEEERTGEKCIRCGQRNALQPAFDVCNNGVQRGITNALYRIGQIKSRLDY